MTFIIFMVVALIFGFLIILFYSGTLTKESGIVELQISGIHGDADKDAVRNFFDKCPCTFGDVIYDGCPATFTDVQKEEDVKKYNSEPVCGIVAEETTTTAQPAQQKPVEQKPADQKTEPAAFKRYQSIEFFGQDDEEFDGTIRLACAGFVGGSGATDCHSEDNDCDGKFKPGSQFLKDGCWIMASEQDGAPDFNDCGQAKVDDGTVIPLQGYRRLVVDLDNDYKGDDDPQVLFSRSWKSKPEYGALLCSKGFWHGCKEANEGQNYILGNNQAYKCTNGEWIKQ